MPSFDRKFRNETIKRLRVIDHDLETIFMHQNDFGQDFKGINSTLDALTSELAFLFISQSEHFLSVLDNREASFSDDLNDLKFETNQSFIQADISCSDRIDDVEKLMNEKIASIEQDIDLLNQSSPDSIHPDLISLTYPKISSSLPSIREYVDAKLKNVGHAIGKQKSILINKINSEHSSIQSDITSFKEYMKEEFAKEITWQHLQIKQMNDQILLQNVQIEQQAELIKNLATSSPEVEPKVGQPKDATVPDLVVVPPSPIMMNASTPPSATIPPPPLMESTILQTPSHHSTSSGQMIFNSVGNVPLPKFNPTNDSAHNFIMELEHFMKRKRYMPEDWILSLPSAFSHDPNQSLWWQRTKLFAHTWDEFKVHFFNMYASESDRHSTLEKLLQRRQLNTEHFQKFAFEMELQYRKVHRLVDNKNEADIVTFIAERSLPYMKGHLLASNCKNVVELINYAVKIERPIQSSQSQQQPNNNNNNQWRKKKDDQPSSSNQVNNASTASSSSSSTKHPNNDNKSSQEMKCSNCPWLNNHTTANCRKNKKQSSSNVNCAQVDETKNGGKSKNTNHPSQPQVSHQGNGQRE